MHANFSLLNHLKPELAELSDAELEKWGQHVARRQKTRAQVMEALELTSLLAAAAMAGVAIAMIGYIGSPVIFFTATPAAIGLSNGFLRLSRQCDLRKTGPDTARLNAEWQRRQNAWAAQLWAMKSPQETGNDCAAAVRRGVEQVVTVSRPLKLMKRPAAGL